MRWLVGLALGAHATVITHLDGSVEEIASTTRKHFGRRTIDLDIAGAPLVVVATSEPVEPDAAGFRDAVVLLEQRPPWCDLGDYRALVKAGARAPVVVTEQVIERGLRLRRHPWGAGLTPRKLVRATPRSSRTRLARLPRVLRARGAFA